MATTWQRGLKRVVITYDVLTGDIVSVDAPFYDRATSDSPAWSATERFPFHVAPVDIPPAWITTLTSIRSAILSQIDTEFPLP